MRRRDLMPMATDVYVAAYLLTMFASSIPLSAPARSYQEHAATYVGLTTLPQLVFLSVVMFFSLGGSWHWFVARAALASAMMTPIWVLVLWKLL